MRRKNAIVTGLLAGVLLIVFSATPAAQSVATQIQIAINQLTQGITPFSFLRVASNGYINFGSTTGSTGYGIRDNAGVIELRQMASGSWVPIDPSGSGCLSCSYWVRTAESSLTNETVMGALGTGLIINTTTTGVPTIFGGSSCSNQFPRSVSAIGAFTCATVNIISDTTGTLTVGRGGTGLSTGTSGGVLYFSAAGTLASSGVLTASQIVLGGGAGAAPTSLGSLGTTTTVLHGNAGGAPTFGAVVLTTDVSGILPSANGGTANAFFTVSGPATSAKTFTFPNASSTVLTTNAAVTPAQGGTGLTSYAVGDLIYADGATSLAKLADVSTGNALISGGITTAPAWGKIGLTTHVTGTLPVANGGTGLTSYTIGDLIYASGATTLAVLPDVATGSVLVSGGVATAPAWSASPTLTSPRANTSILLGAVPTFFAAAPTISSGFGAAAAVTAGTATAFRVDIGTGGTATDGVIGMPTATTGWNCHVDNLTALAANAMDQRTVQTASTTASVTVENQTVSTGAALAWTANDVLMLACAAF